MRRVITLIRESACYDDVAQLWESMPVWIFIPIAITLTSLLLIFHLFLAVFNFCTWFYRLIISFIQRT